MSSSRGKAVTTAAIGRVYKLRRVHQILASLVSYRHCARSGTIQPTSQLIYSSPRRHELVWANAGAYVSSALVLKEKDILVTTYRRTDGNQGRSILVMLTPRIRRANAVMPTHPVHLRETVRTAHGYMQ